MKDLIITMRKVVIARLFLLTILSGGCATSNIKKHQSEEELAFELIEHMKYGKGILNRQTLSFKDLQNKNDSWLFNLEEIDQRNYNRNWVTENKPFVDFDTIFSPEQKLSADKKFRSLKNKKLLPRELNNPEILANNGSVVITFPIIQQGKTGEIYGFIAEYTSPESTLFIFKRTSLGWKEVAKVALGIS